MKTNKPILLGTIALAAVVAAALAAGVGLGGQPTPVLSDGGVAALERPTRKAADALPARVMELPFARHFADPNAARLASRDAQRSVYVVPGRQGALCLVVVEAGTSEIGMNCADRSVLRSGAVWQGTSTDAGATTDIVGVVGDGVAYATADGKGRTPVRGNVFAMSGIRSRTITLGTESGVEAAFDLGDLTPPE